VFGKDFFPYRKDKFVSLVIGHRGAPGVEPENTLASFRAAVGFGADGVELDVRRTADGALAVHHDARLPDGRAIVETSLAEMPSHVPDLAAALDACEGLSLVNVEIKNWPDDVDFDASLRTADAVVELLSSRSTAERERFVVSCFHLPTVDRVLELAPELVTGWLVVGPASADDLDPDGAAGAGDAAGAAGAVGPVAALVAAAVEHGHRAIHPHHAFVTPDLVERAHAEEVAVNTWTCDDPDRIRWLSELGVDGIVTNVPDVALATLGRTSSGAGRRPDR
jgi:glycerophosphoryl diester phosphodiesterase